MVRGLVTTLAALLLGGSTAPPERFLLTLARETGTRIPPRAALVDRSGKLVRRVGGAGYVAVRAEFSPNGESIAWSDPAGVHVENADGTNARLLVPFVPGCNTSCTQPSFVWEPDGTALDVGGVGEQTNELLHVPIDGAPPSHLAPTRPWSNPVPSFWTRGGRELVWSNLTGDPGTASCCVFSVYATPPGGRTRVLFRTRNWHGVAAPVWSPDASRRLMFEDRGLTIVDERTGKRHPLGITRFTDDARWSPDGKTIAVLLQKHRVITITVATGKIHSIGSGEGVFWGRDGTLYVLRGKTNEVWASRANGPERLLFRSPGGLSISALDDVPMN